MGAFFWKWLFRPIVIMFAGTAGVAAIEDSPIAGGFFIFFSIASSVALINDLAG